MTKSKPRKSARTTGPGQRPDQQGLAPGRGRLRAERVPPVAKASPAVRGSSRKAPRGR